MEHNVTQEKTVLIAVVSFIINYGGVSKKALDWSSLGKKKLVDVVRTGMRAVDMTQEKAEDRRKE